MRRPGYDAEEMTEYLLDPNPDERPSLGPGRVAELREHVLREARKLSEWAGVELVFERPRRASDIALLWFEGDRTAVLRAVGGWEPSPDVELQLAHARPTGSRFELSLYVAARGGDVHASD